MLFRPRAVVARVLLGAVLAVAALSAGRASADDATAPAAAPARAATSPTATASQREAAALLERMTGYLAGLPSFSVSFRAGYDVVQPSGQKIEFGETRAVTLARPDRLRVEEIASDGTRDVAVFDGRTISVLDADSRVYAQAPQPATVDEALGYFVRDLKLRMPLALLLTTRLPDVVANAVRTVDLVESTEILGTPAHHVAGRTDAVDFQFWIADGARPLPLRVVITYRQSPGQPQFWANFADWNTSPTLAAETFRFAPPADAQRIVFAVQVPRPERPSGPAAAGEIQP